MSPGSSQLRRYALRAGVHAATAAVCLWGSTAADGAAGWALLVYGAGASFLALLFGLCAAGAVAQIVDERRRACAQDTG